MSRSLSATPLTVLVRRRFFADVLFWFFIERPLAAHRAEIVGLPFIFRFACGCLFVDFHARLQKEIAGEFLDCKADRFRGAGKSAESSGLTPSAPCRRLLRLAPGGKQLSRGAVVELGH